MTKAPFLIALTTLLASPLLPATPPRSGDAGGVVQGTVDCGDRCGKIMVYLEGVDGSFSGEGVVEVFDQKDKVFTPHLLPIVKGTTVRIANSDPFLHNVHAYAGKDSVFNLGVPPHQTIDKVFKHSEKHTILCDVHPEMSAYIVVLDNPFFSPVSADGSFEITGVPAGTYTAVLYHPGRDKKIEREVTVGRTPTRVEFFTAGKGR